MVSIVFAHGLPFVEVTLIAGSHALTIPRVLLDTGSAGTIFRTQDLEAIGVTLDSSDLIVYMTGIGGLEPVIEKRIDSIQVGDLRVSDFKIELGAVEYGFGINGILGANFLLQTKAIIDFEALELRSR